MSKNSETHDAAAVCEKDCSIHQKSVAVIRPHYTSNYDDEAWEVSVRLPGVSKDQVDVSIDQEILEIDAVREQNAPEGGRALGVYPEQRRYRLKLDVGPEVDPEKVSAVQADGVLTLRLPLREEAKARTIEVK